MRLTRFLLAAVVTLVAAGTPAQPFDFRRIDDPNLLATLQHVALLGFLRVDNMEAAAFLVQDGDGISCLLWPHTALIRAARYDGTWPPGTVAVVHSHPRVAPEPSREDVEEAKRIGLPMYVVTRWQVFVVDPSSGERISLIGATNWTRGGTISTCREHWSLPSEARRAEANGSVVMRLMGSPDRH